MAAYEVLNTFINNAAHDSLNFVATLSDLILQRLEATVPMQQQIVSVEDRITLEEMQTSLASAVLVSLPLSIINNTPLKLLGHCATAGKRSYTASRSHHEYYVAAAQQFGLKI